MHLHTIHQQKTYKNINIQTSVLNTYTNAKSITHAFTHNSPTENI